MFPDQPVKETNTVANYSRWDDVKGRRRAPSEKARTAVGQDLDLGQLNL